MWTSNLQNSQLTGLIREDSTWHIPPPPIVCNHTTQCHTFGHIDLLFERATARQGFGWEQAPLGPVITTPLANRRFCFSLRGEERPLTALQVADPWLYVKTVCLVKKQFVLLSQRPDWIGERSSPPISRRAIHHSLSSPLCLSPPFPHLHPYRHRTW